MEEAEYDDSGMMEEEVNVEVTTPPSNPPRPIVQSVVSSLSGVGMPHSMGQVTKVATTAGEGGARAIYRIKLPSLPGQSPPKLPTGGSKMVKILKVPKGGLQGHQFGGQFGSHLQVIPAGQRFAESREDEEMDIDEMFEDDGYDDEEEDYYDEQTPQTRITRSGTKETPNKSPSKGRRGRTLKSGTEDDKKRSEENKDKNDVIIYVDGQVSSVNQKKRGRIKKSEGGYSGDGEIPQMPPARKYTPRKPAGKDDLGDYIKWRERRDRNNDAVRRTRVRKRQKEVEVELQLNALNREVDKLQKSLTDANEKIQRLCKYLKDVQEGKEVVIPKDDLVDVCTNPVGGLEPELEEEDEEEEQDTNQTDNSTSVANESAS